MRLVLPLAALVAFGFGPATAVAQLANVDACSLITASEAYTAIGVLTNQGHHLAEPHKDQCRWTDDTTAGPDHRRVSLGIETLSVFNSMKSSPRLKTEAVSGVGNEAYFIFPSGGDPILAVRKGGVAFQLKVLNGYKIKPHLTADEVKARELVLAAAAAGRA
jgi:hypothetical protein